MQNAYVKVKLLLIQLSFMCNNTFQLSCNVSFSCVNRVAFASTFTHACLPATILSISALAATLDFLFPLFTLRFLDQSHVAPFLLDENRLTSTNMKYVSLSFTDN